MIKLLLLHDKTCTKVSILRRCKYFADERWHEGGAGGKSNLIFETNEKSDMLVSTNHCKKYKIQVTRLWGDENIKTAVVHPAAAAEGCEVELTKPSSLPQWL